MNKKGVEIDEIIFWILALVGLALIIIGIILFRKGGENLIEKIINLFRFR